MLQRCVLMALAAIASLPLQLTVAATRHHTASHSRAEILAIGAKVADWQLAHLDNFDYIPANQFRRDAEAPRDWVQAAFYIGLAAFADTTRNVHYEDAILAHGEAEAWGFDARPRHADADATGAVWVWAAQRTHDPAKLGPIRARFDAVLADPSTVSLEFGSNDARCQERWCWSDALFMAPPTWIALSQACGDERYLAHADQEFWATTHYLYDPEEHLFFRDSRYFTQRDAAGRKIFWSRGNGWVFAGLARILSSLPTNYPSRPRYETLFKQMAARLLSLQGSEGYWPVSLLEPQNTPETSGTGFFVYGLAWGINHGLLPSADYRQAADRGWHALTSAVAPDGKLGWVQPIGAAPDRVGPEDTQLYGVGAFLLAASEMSALP
jgi:unsaturated rhamnogalacturonyl hydrolase